MALPFHVSLLASLTSPSFLRSKQTSSSPCLPRMTLQAHLLLLVRPGEHLLDLSNSYAPGSSASRWTMLSSMPLLLHHSVSAPLNRNRGFPRVGDSSHPLQ